MYYTHRGHGYLRCILLRLRPNKARILKVNRQISFSFLCLNLIFLYYRYIYKGLFGDTLL